MNIKKFNDEGMIFKTNVRFKNDDIRTIYLGEKEITSFMSREWVNPFFAYTDHINTYIRRLDDIEAIDILSASTLTETEYETMLDGLAKRNHNQYITVNVITDEEAISESVKFSLERLERVEDEMRNMWKANQ